MLGGSPVGNMVEWQKVFCQTHISWQNPLPAVLQLTKGRIWTPWVKAASPSIRKFRNRYWELYSKQEMAKISRMLSRTVTNLQSKEWLSYV